MGLIGLIGLPEHGDLCRVILNDLIILLASIRG